MNIALALTVLISTLATGTPWLAIVLVLLSKWRVLAVRPRYWFAHVEANMVDMIVSFGIAVLIYIAGQTADSNMLTVQVGLTVLYVLWLLFLKPRTRVAAVASQAGVAVVVGTMALMSVSYEWPSSVVVVMMWLMGYSCARHVLVSHTESDVRLLSLLGGFIFAEIGWLTYHWTIAYPLFFAPQLKVPQVTILLAALSFLLERSYQLYVRHKTIKRNDIMLPLIFTIVLLIALLFTGLNAVPSGGAV
ncbi:hypothetical protein KC953_02405 [Candidatus Saccharibacteria bacterium]|nr:hypothetical protein [Candidatus Saccharibacteria bacterium]